MSGAVFHSPCQIGDYGVPLRGTVLHCRLSAHESYGPHKTYKSHSPIGRFRVPLSGTGFGNTPKTRIKIRSVYRFHCFPLFFHSVFCSSVYCIARVLFIYIAFLSTISLQKHRQVVLMQKITTQFFSAKSQIKPWGVFPANQKLFYRLAHQIMRFFRPKTASQKSKNAYFKHFAINHLQQKRLTGLLIVDTRALGSSKILIPQLRD